MVSFCLILSAWLTSAISISANTIDNAVSNDYGMVSITDIDGQIELRISGYVTGKSSVENATVLVDDAILYYNNSHDSQISKTDINKITVIAKDNEQFLVSVDADIIVNIVSSAKNPVIVDFSGVRIAHTAKNAEQITDENKDLFSTLFKGNKKLKQIILPTSLKSISSNNAFQGCSALEKFVYPPNLTKLGDDITFVDGTNPNRMFFYGTAVKHIECHSASYNEQLWKNLFGSVTNISYTSADFSGSNITLDMLKNIKNFVSNLNLTDCKDVSFGDQGNLYAPLKAYLDSVGLRAILPDGTSYPDIDVVKNSYGTVQVIAEGGEVELLITDYVTASTSNATSLVDSAFSTYNSNHGTELTTTDITKITVVGKDSEQYLVGIDFNAINGYIKNANAPVSADFSNVNMANGAYRATNLNDTNKNILGSAFRNNGNLKELKLPDTLTQINSNGAFQNCAALESFVYPPNLVVLGDNITFVDGTNPNRMFFYGTAVKHIECHSQTYSEQLWKNLLGTATNINYTSVDFSGSNITTEHALTINNNVTYLNLSDCKYIEYSSDNGKALLKKLLELKKNGATVLMPDPDDMPEMFVVRAESNDSSMGSVSGNAVFEVGSGTHLCTFTAQPNINYTLIGWMINGNETLLPPGTADESGKFTLTVDVSDETVVTAVFEVDVDNLPDGQSLTVDSDGKIHITLTEVTSHNDISIWTQMLVKLENKKSSVRYTAKDIVELNISTAAANTLNGQFINAFPNDFSAQLKSSLQKSDVSGVNFANNTLPASFYADFVMLEEVKLPDGLIKLNSNAFRNCISLTAIKLPDTLQVIADSVFSGSGLIYIDLPEGLLEIGNGAFQNCKSFKGSQDGILYLPASLQIFSSKNITSVVYGTSAARFILLSSQVMGISYHGEGNDALFSNIIGSRNWNKSKYYLNGSGITERQLSRIPFSTTGSISDNTMYLDVRGCPIDYTTTRGKALHRKISQYSQKMTSSTILYDEGIKRPSDYTVVAAKIVVANGETLKEAVEKWCTEQNPIISADEITDLKITTEPSVMLKEYDFEYLRTTMAKSLRKLDLSDALVIQNKIPDNALSEVENLKSFIFPQDIIEIGKNAFFMTDLESINLPDTLLIIGAGAFSDCYNLSGELIIPDSLEIWGDNTIFKDAGFTKLSYHGPLDLQLSTSFAYALQTLEYVDLRGCTGLNQGNVPFTGWENLKVLHLDYCSFDYIPTAAANLIYQKGTTITLHHQKEAFVLETILSQSPYGKPLSEYPFSSNDLYIDDAIFTINDGTNKGLKCLITPELIYEKLAINNEYVLDSGIIGQNGNKENNNQEQNTGSGYKKIVVTKRLKKNNGKLNDETFSWWILILAGAAATIAVGAVIIVKKKKGAKR